MPQVLILGAMSDIAQALGRAFAVRGYSLILVARRAERLDPTVADLKLRGALEARRIDFDITETHRHRDFADALGTLPDIVICATGLLGKQDVAQHDYRFAAMIMHANYTGPALILGEFANRMEQRGSGVIIGIGSVAGDRGRGSNYIYGSAKAGFTAFLSGLRNRLVGKGVHVMTVKPGFVNTRMTEGMKLPKALTAEPEVVAEAIIEAAAKKRDVIYIFAIWRWIMLIIRHIPERIFKRLKL